MTRGVDYSFAYDPTSNTIRLSPIAGIGTNREFQIDLANTDRTVINFNSPTPADGETLTVTDLQVPANSVDFEYDTGFVIVPANGGMDLTDAETFSISQGGGSPVVFELDNDDDDDDVNNVRVPFEDTSPEGRSGRCNCFGDIQHGAAADSDSRGARSSAHWRRRYHAALIRPLTAIDQTGEPGITTVDAIAIPIIPSNMLSDRRRHCGGDQRSGRGSNTNRTK